jgi:uncharacterized membrane protein
MENLIVIGAMLLLCIVTKNGGVPLLIVAGAVLALSAESVVDIALFYAILSAGCMSLAVMGLMQIKESRNCSFVYSMLMVVQSVICFALVPDWGVTGNTVLQYILNQFNDILWVILLITGLISSGKLDHYNTVSNSD